MLKIDWLTINNKIQPLKTFNRHREKKRRATFNMY